MNPPVILTAEMVEAFGAMYLSPRFDNLRRTPQYHRETWKRYCSPAPYCGTAAPREHAKTTGLTVTYGLANACFRVEPFIIVLGATEGMSEEFLGTMADELRTNNDLRRDFHIERFEQDTKTDIIVCCTDNYRFRIIAKGTGQKVRGTIWHNRRPGLIIGDDLEDDEQVESVERRKKFRRWMKRAVIPALRKGGKIRVHGTILHQDAYLARIMKNKAWDSRRYAAHRSANDFSEILWPEQFSEARLRAIKASFVADGDSAGYSQEYLNDPRDDEDSYLLPEYFKEMDEADWDEYMVLAVGCDWAVTTAQTSNRTSFTIGGKRIDNKRQVIDQRVGRWDSAEWLDEMFSIEQLHKPDYWFVEDGQIWKSVKPFIVQEMRSRDIYMNFVEIRRIKDKAATGRALQKEMKIGQWKFNSKATWYPGYKEELLDFSAESEALLDDQFDSTVNLCLGFGEVSLSEGDDLDDDEREFEAQVKAGHQYGQGRSKITGY